MATETITHEPLYFKHPDLYQHKTKVTSVRLDINHNVVVIFEETIFHPQGGGQPSDKGTVNGIPVIDIKEQRYGKNRWDFEVEHVFPAGTTFIAGQQVDMSIDKNWRQELSMLHTAGHLISNYIQTLWNLVYCKCNLTPPKSMYLDFDIPTDATFDKPNAAQIQELIEKCNKTITANPAITEFKDSSGIRHIQIGTLSSFPCGGTHTKTMGELLSISISKIIKNKDKDKEGHKVERVRVSFDVEGRTTVFKK